MPVTDDLRAQYALTKKLGQGGFGTVYKAQRRSDRKLFAVKTMKVPARLDVAFTNAITVEVQLLRQLDHVHIVRFEDYIETPLTKNIIMEFCAKGDLHTFINSHRSQGVYVDEGAIQNIVISLTFALHYCHTPTSTRGAILHRDIKPENVLFGSDGVVKLADFGLGKLLDRNQILTRSLVGTPGYLAPEVEKGLPYDAKTDMYGLGCLGYEMASLKSPTRKLYTGAERAFQLLLPKQYSQDLGIIVLRLLGENPARRPSATSLLAHPAVASWMLAARSVSDQSTGVLLAKKEADLKDLAADLKTLELQLRAKESALRAQQRRLRATLSPSPEL